MRNRRGLGRVVGAAVLCGFVLWGSSCGGTEQAKFNKVGATLASGGTAGKADVVPAGAPLGAAPSPKRDVIYTGSLTIRVDDAKAAAKAGARVADDAGGYLAGSDADLTGDRQVRVTLKVPTDAFEQVVADLSKQGEVEARRIESKDVTDAIVDLEGRLDNAKTSTVRLRELLAKAENVQNIITIEDRLGQRELEIESIGRELQGLEQQVAYSTVRVTYTERSTLEVSDRLPGPLQSLRAGAVTLANIAILAVSAAAFLVPFVPIILLGWYVLGRRRRRRAARAPEPAAQPPVAQQAPPPPPSA